jgi:uncharacterized protein YraI
MLRLGFRRRVQIFSLLFALFAIVLNSGVGSVNEARAADTAEVATDALNLRTDAGTWADVIDVIPFGESVEILDGPTDDGWYEVSYGGETGWVAGEYLAFGGVGGGVSGERLIDVNRSTQEVTLYEGDSAIATYSASLGYDDSDDGFYSTAIGTYYVYALNADLSWTDWGHVYFTDWVAFDPDRDNGFHSWSMDADGNVLPDGDGATGGCVALEPSEADAVYAFAAIGTRVEVHW